VAGAPFNVTARSSSDGGEPAPGWSGSLLPQGPRESANQFTYNTSDIRRQLNAVDSGSATPLGVLDRRIMALDTAATNWTYDPADVFMGRYLNPVFLLRSQMLFPSFSIQTPASPRCLDNPSSDVEAAQESCENESTNPSAIINGFLGVSDDGALAHPIQRALFYDTLIETGSPARALQAWVTSMTRQRYYDALPRFTLGGEAKYSRSTLVFIPSRWDGFAGVVGMVLCHAVATVWMTVWFVRAAKHTMLGNSWQAVAQVISEATAPLLNRASELKDEQVKKVIHQDGTWMRKRYGISRDGKTGRTELGPM